MRRALQGLLIAGKEQAIAVQNQGKRITIRQGQRDYCCGPVLIGCHLLSWAVMADIVEVRYSTVEHVTDKELWDDGYAHSGELLVGLREHYPDIQLTSEVTIVRWENTRGTAVLDLEGTGGIPKEMVTRRDC